MEELTDPELDRLRALAARFDCTIDADFQLLAGAEASTTQAWRKRHSGPPFVLLGNNYLYPNKGIAKFLEELDRKRNAARTDAPPSMLL
jgi:hypothetical protein